MHDEDVLPSFFYIFVALLNMLAEHSSKKRVHVPECRLSQIRRCID
jgi:hypothetical protein